MTNTTRYPLPRIASQSHIDALTPGTVVTMGSRKQLYVVERPANSRGLIYISKVRGDRFDLPVEEFYGPHQMTIVDPLEASMVCSSHGTAPHFVADTCPTK